jgi:hypothetical protein
VTFRTADKFSYSSLRFAFASLAADTLFGFYTFFFFFCPTR